MKPKGYGVIAVTTMVVLGLVPAAAWAQGPFCNGQPATIVGTYETETLEGTNGDDIIYSGGGEDTIRGRDGDDVLCTAGSEPTVLEGNAGNDTLIGGSGDDELYGGTGRDLLDGRTKNRELIRGDLMVAGPGSDKLLGSDWSDYFDPGSGDDRISEAGSEDWLSYFSASHKVRVDLRKGVATGEGRDVFKSITNVIGSPFNDLLLGNGGDNSLLGNDGDDVISGRGANDLLDLGFDWALGESYNHSLGADRMFGGNGRDEFAVGPGGDNAFGEAGQDRFHVYGHGSVEMRGGSEVDKLDLSYCRCGRSDENGSWTEGYGLEVDLREGTGSTGDGASLTLKGIEIVIATGGPDRLFGSDGTDGLRGGAGDDVIRGRGGDDRLSGSYGDDFLYGGPGNDRNDGGGGAEDVCVSPTLAQKGARSCERDASKP